MDIQSQSREQSVDSASYPYYPTRKSIESSLIMSKGDKTVAVNEIYSQKKDFRREKMGLKTLKPR